MIILLKGDPEIDELISACLIYEYEKRPTAHELI
jgi:hypothetical protein